MQCPLRSKETDILLDYCAHKAGAEMIADIEAHIAVCSDCRSFAEAQKSMWSALDTWDDIEISPDFNRRLYARIDEVESQSWWTRLWSGGWGERFLTPFGWRPAMPLITACLTIALAFLLYTPAPPPQIEKKASQQIVKESVDLDQLEKTLDDIDMLNQLTAPASGRNTSM